jgi:hypothetical protein
MEEQLELIGAKSSRPGCNFSRLPAAEIWLVNLRITASEKFPFEYCNECPRSSCYRYKYRRSILSWSNDN